MTRGYRNNNPGNIRLGRVKWKGEVRPSQDKEFCQFTSMAHGYRAMLRLLRNYRTIYGCMTMEDFINRWAPSTENNTSAYVYDVCRQLQVPSSFVIDVNDRESMCALAASISRHENGVDADMREVYHGWELL